MNSTTPTRNTEPQRIRYQRSNIHLVSADRWGRGTSLFASWVREHYAGHILVALDPRDTTGMSRADILAQRGYAFSGAEPHRRDHELLVGRGRWFRAFPDEAAADNEITLLTEIGL